MYLFFLPFVVACAIVTFLTYCRVHFDIIFISKNSECQHNMVFQLFEISHINWDEDLHMIYFTHNQ